MRILEDINVMVLCAIALGLILTPIGLLFVPYLSLILMGILLLTVIKIDLRRALSLFIDVRNLLRPLLLIYVIPGALALLISPFLPRELFIGILLGCIMPCAMSTPFLSDYFKGDREYALSITASMTLLAPLCIPLSMVLFTGSMIEVNTMAIMQTVALLIILPVIIAIIAKRFANSILEKIIPYSSQLSMGLLLLLVWGIISSNAKAIYADPLQMCVLVLLSFIPIGVSYAGGYALGKDNAQKKTLSIASGYKNSGLAIVIAYSLYTPTVALGTIAYTISDSLLLIPLKMKFLGK